MAQENDHGVIKWETQWAAAEDRPQGKLQPSISIIMGCFVLIFSTLLGTVANSMALKYFITKGKRNVFFNAFKIVAMCDILICQLSSFYGLSLVAGRTPQAFSNLYFCLGWSFFWKISVRFSLHLVAVQSTLRTVKIFQPFRILTNIILVVVVTLDLLTIIGITLISSRTLFMPIYTRTYSSCIGHEIRQTFDTSRSISLIWWCTSIAPYPVILSCCVLCFMKLVGRNRAATKRFRQQGPARDFSHSIGSLLVFSLVGFVLNLISLAPISVRNSLYREINEGTDAITIWFKLV